MIPYDFDQSLGNEFREKSIIVDYSNRHTEYSIRSSPLWSRIKKLFEQETKDRYKELRKDILTKENVVKKMNDFSKLIPDETLEKEYTKWKNRPVYEKNYIEDYLDKSLSNLDEKMGLIQK